MAVSHGSRKLATYRSLYHINRAFTAISRHVKILEQSGFMRVPKMRVLSGFVRELQAQISHDVVDEMHAVEDKEMFELGKLRIAWEHYLNPDRPAFGQNRKAAKPALVPSQSKKKVS